MKFVLFCYREMIPFVTERLFVNIYCVSDYNSIVNASLVSQILQKKNNCVLETCCTLNPFDPFQMLCIL